MSFFKNLLNGSAEKKEEKTMPWIPLDGIAHLDTIKEKSQTKTQVIFKHSTRCGISRMVMNQFVDNYGFNEKDLDLYYLDLLNYREVSNEIAVTFDVTHESPQILVVKNGAVVAQASHGEINDVDLKRFV